SVTIKMLLNIPHAFTSTVSPFSHSIKRGVITGESTRADMEKAQSIIADSIDAGAPGVSLGIMYLPECYGSPDEFADMLKPVGERRSLITAHIRGEGDSMVQSVAEAIEIARRAGCALEVSHFKSCGVKNWRRDIHRAIALIEAARAAGQDVTVDFYPYEGGSTALTTMLPPAFVKGDMASALNRLGTPEGVAEFRKSAAVEYADWDNFALTLGWERIIISGVANARNRRFLGMTVTDAAEWFGFEDAAALAAFLMHDESGKTAIINMSMCQDDIDAVAKLPYSSIISDAIYADTDTPHPRMFGAMPKVIREYVKERRLLTMQEAVHKMTQQPARRMALEGRGELTAGAYADILMFDPDRFTDHATFAAPAQLATGLDLMLLNGRKVIENDALLTSAAGRCLRVKR
ncbi:MAG: amidohydrolase family protein, partial [Clostridia bacterium]|nr:amidohydrolase family protein [Clostridia bacterium]